MKFKFYLYLCFTIFISESCYLVSSSNDQMVQYLSDTYDRNFVKENSFCPEAEFVFFDSLSTKHPDPGMRLQASFFKANGFLKMGQEKEAVNALEKILYAVTEDHRHYSEILKSYAVAYLRMGERQNCISNHSAESCILPIKNAGVHQNKTGSQKAIEVYQKLLQQNPKDYESMWLLNIAYMTLGEYPAKVPQQWLIPNLDKDNSGYSVKPFTDIAPNLGLNKRNMAGGTLIDDFNNDGYLDIVTSDWRLKGAMHYFRNDTKGGFMDCSVISDLGRFKGGLNMIQADYNNDGFLDIFVLRGAWMGNYGRQANSLLRNNGDNTFTDVTVESGLFSEHPTQAGVWRDFNNDGWLDLFIGNETGGMNEYNPCELFISNKNGTFTEVAAIAKCQIIDFVKGVSAADYDHDGLQDIVISGIGGRRTLLKNTGTKNNIPQFEDVTEKSGLNDIQINTFPIWFWDYDNDGWQDIFVCGYQFDTSIPYTAATEALGIPNQASTMNLYHNNHDGTFKNVTKEANLNKSVFTMGSNFGDIDNDGYLDMYLGTGNPDYKSLVPNRLFRNMGNGKFADVTVSGRVGNLQKGHGIAINDLDNDGDSDIFIEVGGAYVGDSYNNSLYLNPGQNNNRWINIQLEGTTTNRSAIGSHIKVTFREKGVKRVVYRDVNSGGSFGASALRREIGIGQSDLIDELEITWAQTGKKQVFKNLKPNQFIKIKEGDNTITKVYLKTTLFPSQSTEIPICNTKMSL